MGNDKTLVWENERLSDEPTTKSFITLKGLNGLIRLWTDIRGEIYKVEIRNPNFVGYLEPAEFVDRIRLE